jgi:hypothetical protein
MQVQKIFIVEYNGKTVGVWDSYESAQAFIVGCQQNEFMTSSANIKTYHINNCFCSETNTIEKNNVVHPVVNHVVNPVVNPAIIQEPEISNGQTMFDDKNPAYIEMAKQKIELQHKINLLKIQKKKIEESKNTYANDFKLFELFTESKQKDPNFNIPEIFVEKFNLMTKLNKSNTLSWENFIKEFQHVNMYNDYFGLNSYEELYLESNDENKSDISEELDIESDSNTDTSDDEKDN